MLLIVAGSCSATLDLSNLNLRDFQFFRYQQSLPNGELKTVKPPPPSFGSHIQRAKAGETVNCVHFILTSRLLIFIRLVIFFFFQIHSRYIHSTPTLWIFGQWCKGYTNGVSANCWAFARTVRTQVRLSRQIFNRTVRKWIFSI